MRKIEKTNKRCINLINSNKLSPSCLFGTLKAYREFREREAAIKESFPHFTRFERVMAYMAYTPQKKRGRRFLAKLLRCSEFIVNKFFSKLYEDCPDKGSRVHKPKDPLTQEEIRIIKEYKSTSDKEITPEQLEALQTRTSCLESSNDLTYEDKDELLEYSIKLRIHGGLTE